MQTSMDTQHIEKTLDKLINKVIDQNDKLDRIEGKFEMMATVDQLHDTEDKIISLLHKIDTEVTAIRASQQRHEKTLEDHEGRIDKLELKIA